METEATARVRAALNWLAAAPQGSASAHHPAGAQTMTINTEAPRGELEAV